MVLGHLLTKPSPVLSSPPLPSPPLPFPSPPSPLLPSPPSPPLPTPLPLLPSPPLPLLPSPPLPLPTPLPSPLPSSSPPLPCRERDQLLQKMEKVSDESSCVKSSLVQLLQEKSASNRHLHTENLHLRGLVSETPYMADWL